MEQAHLGQDACQSRGSLTGAKIAGEEPQESKRHQDPHNLHRRDRRPSRQSSILYNEALGEENSMDRDPYLSPELACFSLAVAALA